MACMGSACAGVGASLAGGTPVEWQRSLIRAKVWGEEALREFRQGRKRLRDASTFFVPWRPTEMTEHTLPAILSDSLCWISCP